VALICILLTLYQFAIFGVIILSWFPTEPGTALETAYSFLRRITDPVLMPIRRLMPSVGFGGMRLDLSPMVVLLIVAVLKAFVC
jgi:YggT family protein